MNTSTLNTVKCDHILCIGRTSYAIATIERTLKNGKPAHTNVCNHCYREMEDLFVQYPDIEYTISYL